MSLMEAGSTGLAAWMKAVVVGADFPEAEDVAAGFAALEVGVGMTLVGEGTGAATGCTW
jgi:hypothetical protein